jgi:hypothetical protein
MQFGIMPLFMNKVEPSLVWCGMPLFPALCTIVQCFQDDPSLDLIAFSFFAAKVMDYSIRNVVNEMVCINKLQLSTQKTPPATFSTIPLYFVFYQVYMPLDFESRYLVSVFLKFILWLLRCSKYRVII